MKIKDILAGGRVSVSLEVFPPKKDEGFARMREVVERLCAAKPSFMSVTFGAGGGRDAHTADVAGSIEARGVTALAHQTCVGTDPAQLPARLALLR
ncbi:MAG: methylenetetrahydrofolate reductase, partial [Kiritimatiellae bacterium]|nr:methylenetetrahydrofolate reductase [Kiritimatiellia bacterium]